MNASASWIPTAVTAGATLVAALLAFYGVVIKVRTDRRIAAAAAEDHEQREQQASLDALIKGNQWTIEDLRRAVLLLQTQIGERDVRIEHLETRISSMRDEITDLRQSEKTLKSENARLTTENTELRRRVQQLEQTHARHSDARTRQDDTQKIEGE